MGYETRRLTRSRTSTAAKRDRMNVEMISLYDKKNGILLI
jgi:hypothetical protein